jgi:hypothetical protein
MLLLFRTPGEMFSEFGLGFSLELLFRVAEGRLPRSLPGTVAYKVNFIVSALWYKHLCFVLKSAWISESQIQKEESVFCYYLSLR